MNCTLLRVEHGKTLDIEAPARSAHSDHVTFLYFVVVVFCVFSDNDCGILEFRSSV